MTSSGNDTTGVSASLRTVSPAEFRAAIVEGATVIDVRTPEEFNEEHISGALNLDCTDLSFARELSRLDTKKSYAIYCYSGSRSRQVLSFMRTRGFTSVVDLQGGVMTSAAGLFR
jgi:rhodanese-related sulfurtransferase